MEFSLIMRLTQSNYYITFFERLLILTLNSSLSSSSPSWVRLEVPFAACPNICLAGGSHSWCVFGLALLEDWATLCVPSVESRKAWDCPMDTALSWAAASCALGPCSSSLLWVGWVRILGGLSGSPVWEYLGFLGSSTQVRVGSTVAMGCSQCRSCSCRRGHVALSLPVLLAL